MDQIPLINNMLESETATELGDDRRRRHRYEPYVNHLAQLVSGRRLWGSWVARLFSNKSADRKPADFLSALNQGR